MSTLGSEHRNHGLNQTQGTGKNITSLWEGIHKVSCNKCNAEETRLLAGAPLHIRLYEATASSYPIEFPHAFNILHFMLMTDSFPS